MAYGSLSFGRIAHHPVEFSKRVFDAIKSSRRLFSYAITFPILLTFSVFYLILVPGSKVVQSCGEIFEWSTALGVSHIILIALYLAYLLWLELRKVKKLDKSLYNIWNDHTEEDQQASFLSKGKSSFKTKIMSNSLFDEDEDEDEDSDVEDQYIAEMMTMDSNFDATDGFPSESSSRRNKSKLSMKNLLKKKRLRKFFSFLCFTHCFSVSLLTLLTLSMSIVLGIHLYYWTNTLPITSADPRYIGIQSPEGVQILREDNGMIHIIAKNNHDLYYAQGIACAQERLFQMELHRRAAYGRLSEVVGPSGLLVDKFFRTLGFKQAAQFVEPLLNQTTRSGIQAYVDGVNDYLDTNPKLPLEFHVLDFKPERYSVLDVIIWEKMMSLDLSMNMNGEIIRYNFLMEQGLTPERINEIWPDIPQDTATILSPTDMNLPPTVPQQMMEDRAEAKLKEIERLKQMQADNKRTTAKRSSSDSQNNENVDTQNNVDKKLVAEQLRLFEYFVPKEGKHRASNNWVIHGNLTATGKPLLSNDPHLALSTPSIWIMMHLETPDNSVIGATFAGINGIIIGRNRDIAWGVTNAGVDVQDLYVIEEDHPDSIHYWSDGALKEYTTRKEIIFVKKEPHVYFTVKETVYGPIINDVKGIKGNKPVALRWVALDSGDTTVDAVMKLQTARNWSDFQEALRHWTVPSQNFIYADTQGNIGYICPGKVPVRKLEHSGLWPVSSNSSLHWQSFIPYEELPHVFNPVEGFIATANNRIAPLSYPYVLLGESDWEEPYRATRITEMIKEKAGSLTVDDMKRMQNDYVTLLYRDLKPVLEQMKDPLPSKSVSEWRSKLLKWDGNMTPSSTEATVFETWHLMLMKLVSKEIGVSYWNRPMFLRRALINQGDSACNGTTDGCSNFAKEALKKVLSIYGKNIPEWGDIHEAQFEHPLFKDTSLSCLYKRETSFGGNTYTVNVGPYSYPKEEDEDIEFDMAFGPSYRQIVDLSDLEASWFIHPIGQSENIYSTHFDNYLEKWAEGDYIPMVSQTYEVTREMNIKPSVPQ